MRTWILGAALALAGVTAAGQGLTTPTDWKWRTDAPSRVVSEQEVPDGAWRFVGMPPGWHITTGPGALLYHPEYLGRGNFALEAEVFLFPGTSQEEYGVFIGGRALEPAGASPAWTAFVARRDGGGAILRHTGSGVTALVPWKTNAGVLAHTGSGTAKQILRIEVGPVDIVYTANGTEVGTIKRADVDVDGPFGFRVGKDLNLHVSRLDVLYRLAPPRPPQ